MSKIPEVILQAGCAAYGARFLHGSGSLGDGIEAAYFAIHDHDDWVRPRPEAWTGEGLPPVGTVCEFAGFNPEETTFDDPSVGDKVTVIGHYLSGCVQVAAFTYNCASNFGSLNVSQGAQGCFRPIRTADQIAAEEREKAVAQMLEVIRARRFAGDTPSNPKEEALIAAEALYDAMYRKQVTA